MRERKRVVALILCLGLLGIPSIVLKISALTFPENSGYTTNINTDKYSISVTPETAQYYLKEIEKIEKKAQEQLNYFRSNYENMPHEYAYDSPPFILQCIDIDGDGLDELTIYDRIPLAFSFAIDGAMGQEAGTSVQFNTYSSNGQLCSMMRDVWHASDMKVFYAVAPPYVITTESEYYDFVDYAKLFKMENGKLKEMDKRFRDINWDGDGSATYTDANGKIVHTSDIESVPRSPEMGSGPRLDILEPIMEKARQLGVDLENASIYNDANLGDQGTTFDYYDYREDTKIIKNALQSIIDAGNRGEKLVQPTDSVYQEIVKTAGIWNQIFVVSDCDLTLGDLPECDYLFNWLCDQNKAVESLDSSKKIQSFCDKISPEWQSAKDYINQNSSNSPTVTEVDKTALDALLRALYGTDFHLEAFYDNIGKQNNSFYKLCCTKDNKWYCINSQIGTCGDSKLLDISAITDLGNGLYLAYITITLEDEGSIAPTFGGNSYMLFQKAPDGADLPHYILKYGKGQPNTADIQAVKNRVIEPNTKYDYTIASKFTDKQQYIDYLKQQLEGLNGNPINDKGKLETVRYIEYMYENAIECKLTAKRNKVSINGNVLKEARTAVSELQSQINGILAQNKITLNKNVEITLKLQGNKINFKKPILINVDKNALDYLSEIQTLRVVLDEAGMGFSICTKDLQKNFLDGESFRFSIEKQGDEYKLTFLDAKKKEIPQIAAPISLYLPASTPYASVEVAYGGQLENWGGQYDENNKLIFFSTRYSGNYKVVESDIQLTDIDSLTEEQKRMVRFMVSRGFFTATDGKFDPDGLFSRYDFVTALVKMFYALDKEAQCTFEDVPSSSYYYPFIASAQQTNIAKGIEKNLFSGDQTTKREEIISFCARTLVDQRGYQYPEDLNLYANFTDKNLISNWALKEIALAEQLNLIDGGGSIDPQGEVNRIAAVELLYHLFMLLYEVSPAENQLGGFSNLGSEFPVIPVILVSTMVAVALSIFATLKLTKKKISMQEVSGEAEVQEEIQQEETQREESKQSN